MSDQTGDHRASLLNDPVVEEIRTARRRLWERSGRDAHRL
jgi:hypothetical protein